MIGKMFYIKQICCICLSYNKKVKNVRHLEHNIIVYYHKFTDNSRKKFQLKDRTQEKYLCHDCFRRLKNSYRFWRQCVRNQNILDSYVTVLKSVNKYEKFVKSDIAVAVKDFRKDANSSNLYIQQDETTYLLTNIKKEVCDDNVNVKQEINEQESATSEKTMGIRVRDVMSLVNSFPEQPLQENLRTVVENVPTEQQIQGFPKSEPNEFFEEDVVYPTEPIVQCVEGDGFYTAPNFPNGITPSTFEQYPTEPFYQNNLPQPGLYYNRGAPPYPEESTSSSSMSEYGRPQQAFPLQLLNQLNAPVLDNHIGGINQVIEETLGYQNIPNNRPNEFGQNPQFSNYGQELVGTAQQEMIPFEDHYEFSSSSYASESTQDAPNATTNPIQDNQCPKCFTFLLSNSDLQNHLEQYCIKNPFVCTICKKQFSAPSILKCHMLSHNNKDDKRFECIVCSKKFVSFHQLTNHLNMHYGIKPYSCAKCPRSFVNAASLQRHMVSHMEERPYECRLCFLRFKQWSQLNRHNRVHMGDTKFHCSLCEAKFVRKVALDKHMRVHRDSATVNTTSSELNSIS